MKKLFPTSGEEIPVVIPRLRYTFLKFRSLIEIFFQFSGNISAKLSKNPSTYSELRSHWFFVESLVMFSIIFGIWAINVRNLRKFFQQESQIFILRFERKVFEDLPKECFSLSFLDYDWTFFWIWRSNFNSVVKSSLHASTRTFWGKTVFLERKRKLSSFSEVIKNFRLLAKRF